MIEKKFLKQSLNLANIFSKDPSTKVGCLIFDPVDRSVVSRGYNGMPRGFDDTDPEKLTRPLKYSYFEHAERNAIYNSVLEYFKNSFAIITGPVDSSCVRALISCGTKTVCYPFEHAESIKKSVEYRLLMDAGVSVIFCDKSSVYEQEPVLPNRHKNAIIKNYSFLLELVKDLAKDPYAVGCAFFTFDTLVEITQGYSGMPRGAQDHLIDRYEAPLRQYWVEGAVRNAIFNLVRKKNIFKDKVAAVSATSCIECARALIACETKKIVAVQPSADMQTRWKESFDQTRQMCKELGVELIEIPESEL